MASAQNISTGQPIVKKRLDWVDYAKGIGIFLVVLGHMLRSLFNSDLLADQGLADFIDQWIYIFHMPLFFIISGLFIERSLRKTGKEFILDKLRSIAYPYLVWSVLQTSLQIVAGQDVNNQISWRSLLEIIYQPIMQFWFLYTLFLLSLLYAFLRRLGLSLSVVGAIACLFYCSQGLGSEADLGSWSVIYQVRYFCPYFVLGACLSYWPQGLTILSSQTPGRLLLLSSGLGFTAVGVAVFWKLSHQSWLSFPFAILGSLSVFTLAMFLTNRGWLGLLKQWGQLSLEIYVAHTILSALVRIALQKVFQVDDIGLYLILGTIIGIYGPIFLNYLSHRFSFPYLFTLRSRAA